MKPETKIAIKTMALQLAADARRDKDDIAFVYEQGQAIYEWFMEDVPEDIEVEGTVVNMRPVN